jgi:nitroreductase/NAD-dependent dihydropyrimidine dehydrogenase PreA subunit
MALNQSTVNHETCKACAYCADICPNMLLELSDEKKIIFKSDFQNLCIICGHCMAVCPTNSIQIEGLNYETDFFPIDPKIKETDSFQNIIKKRRAVRLFKDKAVPKELLEKIAIAMTFAPVGFTPSMLHFQVISNQQKIKEALPGMLAIYEKFIRMMKNPIIRYFIRKSAGEENYLSLKDHVIPILKAKMPAIKKDGLDPIFRNAPAVILIHASKKAASVTEDGLIALSYGFLAAESLGLGTCPISLIPPALNYDEKLKQIFGIPPENKVISSFIIGYPKYRLKKSIYRKVQEINYVS